jgi:hypothetical protein
VPRRSPRHIETDSHTRPDYLHVRDKTKQNQTRARKLKSANKNIKTHSLLKNKSVNNCKLDKTPNKQQTTPPHPTHHSYRLLFRWSQCTRSAFQASNCLF